MKSNKPQRIISAEAKEALYGSVYCDSIATKNKETMAVGRKQEKNSMQSYEKMTSTRPVQSFCTPATENIGLSNGNKNAHFYAKKIQITDKIYEYEQEEEGLPFPAHLGL